MESIQMGTETHVLAWSRFLTCSVRNAGSESAMEVGWILFWNKLNTNLNQIHSVLLFTPKALAKLLINRHV